MACFPMKARPFRLASALQNAQLVPRKERDYARGAAAAYDAQEVDLLTNTRKVIAASKRALRDAEAVLKLWLSIGLRRPSGEKAVAAVEKELPPGWTATPLGRYRTTLTGRSSLGASLALRLVCFNMNWVLGLSGMKRDILDGRTFFH
jgi:hypothetical protein